MRTHSLCLPLIILSLTQASVLAQNIKPRERDLFENFARPMIVAKCLKCHGEKKQEGNLDLRARDLLLKGGESGPAINIKNPEKSLLLEAIGHESLEMPPEEKLPRNSLRDVLLMTRKMPFE